MLKRSARALPDLVPVTPLVQLWALRMALHVLPRADLLPGGRFVSESLLQSLGQTHLLDADMTPASVTRMVLALDCMLQELAQSQQTSPPDVFIHCHGIAPLAEALGLNAVETDVLEFACAISTDAVLRDVMSHLSDLDRQQSYMLLCKTLGHGLKDIKAAVSRQGILARSGVLLLRSRETVRGDRMFEMLNGDLASLLAEPETELKDVLGMVVHASAPCGLGMADFPHLQPQLGHLLGYLTAAMKDGAAGVNVLLYGPPGTGKTELARVLAQQLHTALYEVSSHDSDGDPSTDTERMKALMLAQVCLSRGVNLLLFDEVEDVLQPRPSLFEDVRQTRHKAWMHRQLETNAVPTVWVTNSVAHMDPAMTRRFDVVMEMPVPPRAQREHIIRAHTGTELPAPLLAALADHDALSPAIVARAVKVARVQPDAAEPTGNTTAGLAHGTLGGPLLQLVNQTLKAQGLMPVAPPPALDLWRDYSLAHLNPDTPLPPLVDALAGSASGRFCLYGPPGTGKSAFVRWVAQRLDRPLLVRHASDLLSAWVGGSEKNIAAAFAQAHRDDAVLLIDEVDSFLQPRQHAVHGWEASMVNEMLTQMEAFEGILFATTNLFKGMDEAAMRRFDVKVHFKAPTALQLQALLDKLAAQLGIAPLAPAQCSQLAQLAVTPGDVAAVARRAKFAPLRNAPDLFAALQAEGHCKPGAGVRTVGFV